MSDDKWVLSGQLYVVATPIGNLADLSPRAQAVLQAVDRIAAEDTRHSGQLLAHLGIRKSLISLHEHNERQRAQQLIEHLQAGEAIAYISDAGVPAVSDPGALLVAEVAAAGINVVPIPGASSVVTALCASGLDSRAGFTFAGFAPTNNKEKAAFWAQLDKEQRVSIFFEAPHRLMTTLNDIANRWPDRQMVVAKELTKRFERFVRGTTQSVLNEFHDNPEWQKGEFVFLLAPLGNKTTEEEHTYALSLEGILLPLLQALPLSQAVKVACQMTGQKKKPIYDLALQLQETLQ